jgi:hypothetical protein
MEYDRLVGYAVKPDWEGDEDRGDNCAADPASLIKIWSKGWEAPR